MRKILIALIILMGLAKVSVGNERLDKMIRPFVKVDLASGTVIRKFRDKTGNKWAYILTAGHVTQPIKDQKKVRVEYMNIKPTGEILSTHGVYGHLVIEDLKDDFSIVVAPVTDDVPSAAVSQSQVSVFDDVYAVGWQHLELWPSTGVVSNLNPNMGEKTDKVSGYIAHTANTSPGSSGGPLFNNHYVLIGINLAGLMTY